MPHARFILIGLLLCIIALTPTLSAQSQADTSQAAGQHLWTLEFGVTSNFTLTSFQGATISFSRKFAGGKALRAGIWTGFTGWSEDNTHDQFQADTTYSHSSGSRDEGDKSVAVIVQGMSYSEPIAHTALYFALGPIVQYDWWQMSMNSDRTGYGNQQQHSEGSSSGSRIVAGLLCSLGAEWFFSEPLTLHAEYNLQLSRFWGKSRSSDRTSYGGTNNYADKDESTSTGWSLYSNRILLGLSFHF